MAKKVTKTTEIKREIELFSDLLIDLDDDVRSLAKIVIDELAFMRVVLRDLKNKVNEDGVVTEMVQGSYSIDRENPALKSYNTTVQRYTATLKQLFDMLDTASPETSDERNILAFAAKKK